MFLLTKNQHDDRAHGIKEREQKGERKKKNVINSTAFCALTHFATKYITE
jgi:hypothetical protein